MDHPSNPSTSVVPFVVCKITLLIIITFFMTACDFIINPLNSLSRVSNREMVAVSGGTYTQSDGTTSFAHNISTFMIAKYEVTYELWYVVYQWAIVHGYHFGNSGCEGSAGTDGAPPTAAKEEPVTRLNWCEAIVWCNAYSEVSRLIPCYRYAGAIIRDSADMNAIANGAVCDWGVSGYRLPSEGEWQFAASDRGVTPFNYATGAYTFYNDSADVNPSNGLADGKEANDQSACYHAYWDGSAWQLTGVSKSAAVGSKKPNACGLYDMSGNVKELCWDTTTSYPTEPQTDYRGFGLFSLLRIMRGGSWNDQAQAIQVGQRGSTKLSGILYDLGFRVAQSHGW